ncbi:MAG: sterol desaturase family protein [Planctomycetota bacterium]|nr:sterol desaturase family protein [Planctomycetaceae bacterium]MDQ3329631.1 sterol desaturase family protein [Planctomycetota bacterium]
MPTHLPPWAPLAKPALTIACFVVLWGVESILPFFAEPRHRWRHAGRNLAIALLNAAVLAFLFASLTVAVADWSTSHQFGLLNQLHLPSPLHFIGAIVLLDLWLYVWHRLNHRVPFLWRFHRMHHSDHEMDVSTATRFHLGEHIGAATLRLGLIPVFGITAIEILIYETLVVAVTMFHHANISIGRFDRPLRWLTVTPFMHKVHHSRLRHETDSNYSTLFSLWDRCFGSFRMRNDCRTLDLGLDGMDDDDRQTIRGMLLTPLRGPAPVSSQRPSSDDTVDGMNT